MTDLSEWKVGSNHRYVWLFLMSLEHADFAIPYGTLLPIRVSRVLLTGSSGTTAIVALW